MDVEITQHRITLLPKQRRFVDEKTARYKAYSGSRAAGKSYALCVDVVEDAKHPGVRTGLYRMNYSDLVGTTLLTLLEGDDLPPVLPNGSYTHNQQKHRIDIHGGGTILYGGFDKGIQSKEDGGTGSKSSVNLTSAAVDEAVQVPEGLINQLAGGVRMKHPVVNNQIKFACNPGPPMHWMARRFGLSLDHTLQKNHFVVRTNIFDNFMLPAGFADDYGATLSGVAYMRYIWGLWVGSDGVVYDAFSRDLHSVLMTDYTPTRTVWGVDPGTNDPYAIVRGDELISGNVHIPYAFYERGHTPSDQVEILKNLVGDSGDLCVVDSAYPGLIEDMRRADINAVPCKKGADSIMRGVGVVSARLKAMRDGVPGLTISPHCVDVINEFETYEYDKNAAGLKDKPKDAHNHAMDSIRYLLESIDGVGGAYVSDPINIGAGNDDRITDKDLEPMANDEIIDLDEIRRQDPRWGYPGGGRGNWI